MSADSQRARQGFIAKPRRVVSAGDFEVGHWTSNITTPLREPHGHELAHFLLVISGEYFTTARGTPSALGTQLIYSPCDVYHEDRLVTGSGSFLTITFDAEAERLAGGLPLEPVQVGDVRPQMLARRMARVLAGENRDALSLESLCLELVGFTAGACPPDRRRGHWLEKARDALSDLSEPDLSLAELSEALGVHPVHLTRSFRKHFGCTPGEYRRARRLSVAAELLTRSDRSLAEIALDCGFTDQSHFSNQFTGAYGMSPGVYRQMTRPRPRRFVFYKTH